MDELSLARFHLFGSDEAEPSTTYFTEYVHRHGMRKPTALLLSDSKYLFFSQSWGKDYTKAYIFFT